MNLSVVLALRLRILPPARSLPAVPPSGFAARAAAALRSPHWLAIPMEPTGGAPDDPAGVFVDPATLARARGLGLDPAAFLADNNSTEFFEKLGDLVVPGPTLTKVNDIQAVLVEGADWSRQIGA